MTCAICREPIPDDAPVIETPQGENLCEACHEERRGRRSFPTDAEIDANLDRNHNILCGCTTPYEGECALAEVCK